MYFYVISLFTAALVVLVSVVKRLFGFYNTLKSSKSKIENARRIIFITGCDSGFGYLFATKFHSLGYIIVACVLQEDSVGANILKAYSSERMKVLKLDLNLEIDISSCHQEVEKIVRSLGIELWAFINNGAVTNYIASVELMPIEVYRRYIEANIIGTLNLTRRFLPLLKKSKGRIINISSLTATMHLSNMSGYSVCKSALNTISDCLRQELFDDGVKVCVIQPSGFITAGLDRQYLDERCQTQWKLLEEERQSNNLDLTERDFDLYQKIQKEFRAKITKCQADLSPVFEVVYHAVTNCNPNSYYPVGTGAATAIFLCSILPTNVSDWIIRTLKI